MMLMSCRTWFELTEVVCTVSCLPGDSGNSGSQLQLMDHKRQTVLSVSCRTWFELTEVVCTVSSLPGGSGNSGS